MAKRNRNGTRLSKHGYVICSKCGVEVTEISRDTVPQYALCRSHGTWGRNLMLDKEKDASILTK